MKMATGESSFALIGSLIGLIAFLHAIIPDQAIEFLTSILSRFLTWTSTYTLIDVNEFVGLSTNELYDVVDLHLSSLTAKSTPHRLELSRVKNTSRPRYALGDKQTILEIYKGHPFKWIHHVELRKGEATHWKYSDTRRRYTLMVNKHLQETLLPEYLDHVNKHAEELQHLSKKRMLYTNYRGDDWETRKRPWRAVRFDHPATFSSMAMDPELKDRIMNDLVSFMAGEEYFRKIGRAWKRGYLLYGPPGTGKSSLVAAIGEFTGYDIYDFELTAVKSNSELRTYLTAINDKAIVVIEDIDCTIDLKNRGGKAVKKSPEREDDEEKRKEEEEDDGESRITLSGVLNFTDGLWSCTGKERIIIFTTNHIEKLDPALIRTGRMDLHICMSYCKFPAFKTLAWTHLDLKEHELFPEIEKLLQEVDITPADVAEILIQNKDNANAAMESLVESLKTPKTTATEPQ